LPKSFGYGMVQAIGSSVGGFSLGCLMDALGRKQGLFLTYLFGGLSVLLFGLATSDASLFFAGAATGMFLLGSPTALHVVCGETYPTHIRSTGLGWGGAAGRAGSILGPIIGGLLQAAGLQFRQFFMVFALPCFICMVLVLLYRVNGRGESLERISTALEAK
jgi:MFS family permease